MTHTHYKTGRNNVRLCKAGKNTRDGGKKRRWKKTTAENALSGRPPPAARPHTHTHIEHTHTHTGRGPRAFPFGSGIRGKPPLHSFSAPPFLSCPPPPPPPQHPPPTSTPSTPTTTFSFVLPGWGRTRENGGGGGGQGETRGAWLAGLEREKGGGAGRGVPFFPRPPAVCPCACVRVCRARPVCVLTREVLDSSHAARVGLFPPPSSFSPLVPPSVLRGLRPFFARDDSPDPPACPPPLFCALSLSSRVSPFRGGGVGGDWVFLFFVCARAFAL